MQQTAWFRFASLNIIALLFFTACNTPAAKDTDPSLTTEEYMALGMPTPKQAWTASEFVAAVNVMTALKDTNNIPLKGSAKSGETFDRLTAVENLKLISDSSRDLMLRMKEFIVYLQNFPKLLALYHEPQAKKQHHAKETVYVTTFALKMMQDGMAVAKLYRDKEPGPKAEQGYAGIKSEFANFSRFCINMLAETETYKEEDLIYLSAEMKPFLNQTLNIHDETTRADLAASIQSIIAKTKIKEVRDNLQQVKLD